MLHRVRLTRKKSATTTDLQQVGLGSRLQVAGKTVPKWLECMEY